jgi:hypothetical protein
MRGVLRALARERKKNGLGSEQPFEFIARKDGRFTLHDPATNARIDLEAFGPTNASVFSRLLTIIYICKLRKINHDQAERHCDRLRIWWPRCRYPPFLQGLSRSSIRKASMHQAVALVCINKTASLSMPALPLLLLPIC